MAWSVILVTLALNLGLGIERRKAIRAAAVPMAAFLVLWVLFSWLAVGV